jgi:hypothetical protein
MAREERRKKDVASGERTTLQDPAAASHPKEMSGFADGVRHGAWQTRDSSQSTTS